jgi:peptide-methionine (S)-S-oxide reductase
MFGQLIRLAVLGTLGIAAGLAAMNPLPNPVVDLPKASGEQTAVLAGGCFWCTEAVFEHVIGVKKVISGYSGSTKETAHYEIVGSGRTDHAESIQVTFDPAKVSYGTLLKVFFGVAHDPTTKDRQGPDWGRQYRSAIFYANEDQKRVAEAYIKQLDEAGVFKKPIVTQVVPLKAFYPAEEYHQDFVARHPDHPYVVVNSIPKLHKLEKTFPDLYRK